MDPTIEYLWAAGYDLPPDTILLKAPAAGKTTAPSVVVVASARRGKKAAKAKRARAK